MIYSVSGRFFLHIQAYIVKTSNVASGVPRAERTQHLSVCYQHELHITPSNRRQQQHSTVFHYSRNLYIIKQMASLQTNTALLSEGEGVSTRKTLKPPPQQTGRPRQDLERWDLALFQVSSSQILPQCCPSMCTAKDNYVVLFMMVFPYTKWL